MIKKIVMLGIISGLFFALFKSKNNTARRVVATGSTAVSNVATTAANTAKNIRTVAAALPYMPAIIAAEQKYGIPTGLLYTLLKIESEYRPDIISGKTRSNTGAVGIAQFLPSTAADELGLSQSAADKQKAIAYVINPDNAIPLAAKYLRKLYDQDGVDSWDDAMVAYNQGAGAVRAAKRAGGENWLQYIKPEGQNYLAKSKTIMQDVVT